MLMQLKNVIILISLALLLSSLISIDITGATQPDNTKLYGQSPVMPTHDSIEPPLKVLHKSSKPSDNLLINENKSIIEDTSYNQACDVIYYKSGRIEYCKIYETNPKEIVYKMCDYQDGPIIKVSKADIYKISYANGREELVNFNNSNSTDSQSRRDPFAVLSMIFSFLAIGIIYIGGIISAALLLNPIPFFFVLSLLLSIMCLAFGITGLVRILKSNGKLRGRGIALTGMIISSLTLLISFAILISEAFYK